MAIHTFAAKQSAPSSVSASKNHHPAQSPEGRVAAPVGQPLNLQRKIGNRATAHILAQRQQSQAQQSSEKASGQQTDAGLIQRFPSADVVERRSSTGSKSISFSKLATYASGSLPRFEKVIQFIKLYNNEQETTKVGISQQARQAQENTFARHLDQIQAEAQQYITEHEEKGDRPETVNSFRELEREIATEKLDLAAVSKNSDFDKQPPQENKVAWKAAVGMAVRSSGARNVGVGQLIVSLGLPFDYVANLDPMIVDHLLAADQGLKDGDVRAIEDSFAALAQAIPTTWKLIKSSLLRKHIGTINPQLGQAIQNPNFTSNLANPYNQDWGPEFNFGKYFGGQNLGATQQAIDAEQNTVKKGTNEPVHKQGWAEEFKARQAWEKKNVKPSDYQKLAEGEQQAIAHYSDQYEYFNNALRGDVRPGEKADEKFDDETLRKTQTLISALNKLPPYKGPVYRHDAIFTGFNELNRVGAVLTDMAFVSSTREANTLRKVEGSGEPEVLSVIQSKSGRFIKPLSKFNTWKKDENEVLFKPGTRFRITKRYNADPNTSGPQNFRDYNNNNMDPELKSALDTDSEKAQVKVVLKKIEE